MDTPPGPRGNPWPAAFLMGGSVAKPTIRTPEKETEILSRLRLNGDVTAACRAVRIAKDTYYVWRHKDPEFRAATDEARAAGLDARLDRLEDALIERGELTDTTAAIFMLKSHRRAVYGERVKVEHTITREAAERIAADTGLDVAEVMAEAEAILRAGRVA